MVDDMASNEAFCSSFPKSNMFNDSINSGMSGEVFA